ESGITFDPQKPINDSKNNTGLRELPPTKPAYVYYPYDESKEFPQVGSGGRNAMAGPTYYSDLYPNGGGLPEYFNGKTIIYEWMRGWMKAVSFFEDGTLNKMEPFASDIKVNNLIDMEMGPNGRVYLLEYGSGWFTQNENSGLSYIEYNGGNRPPIIDNMVVDHTSGKLPLTIIAKVEARDREEDAISYVWNLGNGETKETTEPEISHTFDAAGQYRISVEVKDDKGDAVQSDVISIVAGNSRPEVAINLDGGATIFEKGVPVKYEVKATDADGETIDPKNIFVSVDYLESFDEQNMSLGHQQVSAAVTGKALTQGMDCKTCHKEAGPSIGPNYKAVADKYIKDKKAKSYLQKKIVSGGGGVWGEVVMPAHPNITQDETRQVVEYIMSLAETSAKVKSLPASGSIVPKPTKDDKVMVITASYTDKGQEGTIPLTGMKTVVLKEKGSDTPK
ncbi:PKD domain-containing protein, partial [Zobellia amurskyensis]